MGCQLGKLVLCEMERERAGRLKSQVSIKLAAVGFAGLVLVGCGQGTTEGSEGSSPVPEEFVSTTQPAEVETPGNEDDPQTDPTALPEGQRTAEELIALIMRTVGEPYASFTTTNRFDLPGADPRNLPYYTTREGTWDDLADEGFGTLEIPGLTADDAVFEIRLDGSTLWTYNVVAEPRTWGGVPFEALLETVEEEGHLLDGDRYLLLLASAIEEVYQVDELPIGGATWRVEVRADELLPILVASGGTAVRFLEDWSSETGLTGFMTIVEDSDGYISGFNGDFSAWWTELTRKAAGEQDRTLQHQISFRLKLLDEPPLVESPCPDPIQQVENDAVVLICN